MKPGQKRNNFFIKDSIDELGEILLGIHLNAKGKKPKCKLL